MSKEVDALVIIGHSHLITQEARRYNLEGIGYGLSYIRNGRTQWYNHQPITEEDKTRIFAGEIFLKLGELASSHYTRQLQEHPQDPNPFREIAVHVLDEISPFEGGEVLPEELAVQWANTRLSDRGLPKMFNPALMARPPIEDELREKWHRAQAIHARRGTVAIRAYDTSALLQGLSALNIEEVEPNEVGSGEGLGATPDSYNIGGLVDRTGVQARLVEVPYYQTFDYADKNIPEMLATALEDLRLVRAEIT